MPGRRVRPGAFGLGLTVGFAMAVGFAMPAGSAMVVGSAMAAGVVEPGAARPAASASGAEPDAARPVPTALWMFLAACAAAGYLAVRRAADAP